MPAPLKLALVTDIHYGGDSPTKRGTQALAHLEAFARFCTSAQPDLVVDMGDRLNDVNREADRVQLARLAEAFSALPVPHRHLLGNHDVNQMRPEDNEELLGQSMASCSVRLKGWQLVFWQADTRLRLPGRTFAYRASDLEWLRAELAAADAPCIVFSHIPLDGGSMQGNYYFQNSPWSASYQAVDAVQAVLSASGKVAACVSGHVHWNTLNVVDGIPFFCLQSLTEQFTQPQGSTGTWGLMELDEEMLRLTAHGADPALFTVHRRDVAQRWMPPRPPNVSVPKTVDAVLPDIQGLILDMDGVLYRGEVPIPGAADFVRWWQGRGGRVVTLTNNARRSAAAYSAKLQGMGIDLPATQILTAADAAASWLLRGSKPQRVLVLGSAALRQTLQEAGLDLVADADVDAGGVRPDVVVAGYEPGLTLADLARAVRCLHQGATLVATNPDQRVPTPDLPEPECGSVIAYLEAATGQTATVLGKPHGEPYQLALARLGLSPQAVLAVGDTLETDVAGAIAAGLPVALVHTAPPAGADPGPQPSLALPDLAALQGLLEAGKAST